MMMAIDDKQFFAWLDGELDGEQAERVAAEVADDRRLARLAEQHQAFEARLRGAFAPIAAAPVPERLTQAVKPLPADIIDSSATSSRNHRSRWAPLPQWAAMAATLALGIGLGTTLNTERDASPVEVRGGKMFAAAELDETLDNQLASAAVADVRVGLTFRDQSGTICRSFTDQRSSGLACREEGRWQVRGLFAAPEGQNRSYRMATGVDPNLGALIDSLMAGDPFDAREEKRARRDGWR